MEDLEVKKEDLVDADRMTRLGSLLIDTVILCIITIPIGYFLGLFDGISQQPPVQPPFYLAIVMLVIGIATYSAVNWKLLGASGQTIGKKFNNIKIVNLDGTQTSRNTIIFKRYLSYSAIPMIPVVGTLVSLIGNLLILGKSKRCLHDRIAGTRVIKG